MSRVGGRRFVLGLVVAYLVGLAVVVASPWGWELNRLTVRLYVLFRNDLPFAPDLARPEHYGVLLNVVLFLPLGVLLAVMGRPWWVVALLSLAGSVVIELSQWRWLEREGDWLDVVANTAGGLLGAVAVRLVRRARPAPGPPAGPARLP